MNTKTTNPKIWEEVKVKITDVKKGEFIILSGNSYYVTSEPYNEENVYYVPTANFTFQSTKNIVEVYRPKVN